MTSFIRNIFSRLKSRPVSGLRSLNTSTYANTPRFQVPILAQVTSSNNWIYKQEESIKLPVNVQINPISVPDTTCWIPNTMWWVPPLEEPVEKNIIKMPSVKTNVEKRAARLIVIRRKKMKKHKLRKLRKKMKYEWAKKRQRRELKKEKEFQAGLIAQCKKAEAFSAEAYVEERLEKLNEVPLPNRWKGRRLPEFIIREKLGLPPKGVQVK